ncbi:MAG: glycosyltransferase, partial [Clostridia bacterium]|nr:glycosyltransferase [Clostridia bacterium]
MAAYSVLMSVYHKEKPEHFRMAIQSMLDQTVRADDFVIVCDGPLTDELNGVLAWAEETLGKRLTIVRLPVNGGLGKALNEGLKH